LRADKRRSAVAARRGARRIVGRHAAVYGHSRMRELVLGGVTRTLLTTMTVPVFLSY
jgi:nucleotide-binding universal stress UspA family protein